MTNNLQSTEMETVIYPDQLFNHWLGHRKLTRKTIEAFPEDKLFSYSVGGMRPFSAMVLEFIGMAVPGLRGVVSGKWQKFDDGVPPDAGAVNTKEDLLRLWDAQTEQMIELWQQIPAGRFQEHDISFGMWEGSIYFFLFYWIDNEIHHRGQAYVYLRSLGIEPPAFWDRE